MQQLESFIVRAKAACYVGNGAATAQSSRSCAHDLTFTDGDWHYRDSYFGSTDFLGQEIVWHNGAAVWGMNYYGRVTRSDLIDASRAGRMIKTALSALYREHRFLGGFEYEADGYRYIDTNSGGVSSFTGIERILRNGDECYRLEYHGGMIV